jgi:hypothetical protein
MGCRVRPGNDEGVARCVRIDEAYRAAFPDRG